MSARAVLTTVLLLLLSAAPAAAASRDRDRDRMPDRWERKHRVSKPRADADRDGLKNLAEYRAGTNPRKRDTDRDRLRDGDESRFGWNPRKRDSDGDGILDGRENSGVITAVDGPRVTIKLAVDGSRLTGGLEDASSLDCVVPPLAGTGSSGGPGADAPLPEPEWQPEWGPQPADPDADDNDDADAPFALLAQASGDDWDDPGEPQAEEVALDPDLVAPPECQARLKVGALVREAESEPHGGARLLTLVRLVPPKR